MDENYETCEASCSDTISTMESPESVEEGRPFYHAKELSPSRKALMISTVKMSLFEFDEAPEALPLSDDASICTSMTALDSLPDVEVGEDADNIFLDAIMESMGMQSSYQVFARPVGGWQLDGSRSSESSSLDTEQEDSESWQATLDDEPSIVASSRSLLCGSYREGYEI